MLSSIFEEKKLLKDLRKHYLEKLEKNIIKTTIIQLNQNGKIMLSVKAKKGNTVTQRKEKKTF